jgi:hypothetical protein
MLKIALIPFWVEIDYVCKNNENIVFGEITAVWVKRQGYYVTVASLYLWAIAGGACELED